MEKFDKLLEIMETLRSEDGCPWDREQTLESIMPFMIEEAHEVYESVLDNNMGDLREELGDLLLQVVFLSQIAKEDGHFSIEDVAAAISEKLIRRHPHVFGEGKSSISSDETLKNWEAIKKGEKKDGKKVRESILDGVPRTMPALIESYKLRDKAARVGFDFPSVHEAFEKVKEEMNEFEETLGEDDIEHMEEEMGDMLFTIVNVAAKAGIDPEAALKKANKKFRRRFKSIEDFAKDEKRELQTLSLEEMDSAWDVGKQKEKK